MSNKEKIVFEVTKYEGSICHTSTMNCNDKDQLSNRLQYSEAAVISHKTQGNMDQSEFFQKDVDLVKSKLAKL